jgi:hypothetical protein
VCPDVPVATFPVLEALFGPLGLLAAALLAVPAAAGVALAAPCVFALGRLAGAGDPEGERSPGARLHQDGGVYDGDWFQGAKDGSGVYMYTRFVECVSTRCVRAHVQGMESRLTPTSIVCTVVRNTKANGVGTRNMGVVFTCGPKGAHTRVNGVKAGDAALGRALGRKAAKRLHAGAGKQMCLWNPCLRARLMQLSRAHCKPHLQHETQACLSIGRWTVSSTRFFDPASVHLFAAAAAAPGSLRGVLTATAIAPAFLALCASLLVWAADVVIPPSAASFVAHLANAHRPLTLLSLGAALADGGARIVDGRGSEALTRSMAARLIRLPPPPQLRAALATLVLKYVTSLVLAAGIAAAVALAASTGDVYGWSASGLACAVACALVAPVSPMAVYYAEQQRNAAASAAPLVASVSLGVSAVCWAVIGGLHASGVAATSPWVAPAASLALAAACYLAASVAAAALAPRRMRTTKAAFQAATGRGGAQAALGRMTHTRYDRRHQHNTTQLMRVAAPAMPGWRLRCVLGSLHKPLGGRTNAAAPPHPRTRQCTVHGGVRVTLLSLMA